MLYLENVAGRKYLHQLNKPNSNHKTKTIGREKSLIISSLVSKTHKLFAANKQGINVSKITVSWINDIFKTSETTLTKIYSKKLKAGKYLHTHGYQ